MRRDGSFVKVERITQIKKQIAKQFPEPVDIDKLKIWVECNVGLGKEKTGEYIELAVQGMGWVVVDGKIIASPSE